MSLLAWEKLDRTPLPAARPAALTGELAEPSSQPERFIGSLTFSQPEIDGRPPESKGSMAPGVRCPSVAELGFVRAVLALHSHYRHSSWVRSRGSRSALLRSWVRS